MKLNIGLTLLMVVSLVSCGEVWVIERHKDGGIIGYKGFSDSEDASNEIKKNINCSSYEVISDRIVYGETRTSYMPVKNTDYSSGSVYGTAGAMSYNEQTTRTNYVPIQTQNSWRELNYRCANSNQSSQAQNTNFRTYGSEVNLKNMTKEELIEKDKENQNDFYNTVEKIKGR